MIRKSISNYLLISVTFLSLLGFVSASAGQCDYYQAGVKNLYWGDLHTHTAYSLDAWGFGTIKTPRDAYRFARGEGIEIPGGTSARLNRPLDFAAVTDHAEWYDVLYVCTDPEWKDDPYCSILKEKNSPETGIDVFREYVGKIILGPEPNQFPLCSADQEHCDQASVSQWQRIQNQTNAENSPCEFTALNAFEWSASPNASHGHRNIIFASENVTGEAIDYIRYPGLDDLFEQLDMQCKPEAGCDVLSIPHNTNMGDGIGFDVETESERVRQLRGKYERLVEIFQEKGNSECLLAFGDKGENDCDFELRLSNHSRPKTPSDYSQETWEKMRGTYVRGLLSRGLKAYQNSGGDQENPLQLGILASTDNHTATPGFVEEDKWTGPVFGIGDFDRAMSRVDWNPGGLVAVWAEENTRASLFAALKRREVYGTSGPRIGLKFSASVAEKPLTCNKSGDEELIVMGADFKESKRSPQFLIVGQYDEVPLVSIEIIKGELINGEIRESRIEIWKKQSGGLSICDVWEDPDFDSSAPAFWYPRIKQAPTPRWSAVQCKEMDRCDDYPDAVQTIQEQAWGSPIWYLPEVDSF